MFQTEPILYLQSMASDWLTILMILITSMGSSVFFAVLIIVIAFGIDFRRGYLLFQLLLWTGGITEILKIAFSMPRPDFVDSRVLNLEMGNPNTSPFTGKGADNFFELPEREAVEAFREGVTIEEADPLYTPYGFPSGHVSTTTALWGGSAIVFGREIIWKILPAVVLLMAFTRMYLGRHFLGDVLGGAVLGLIILALFSKFIRSPICEAFFRKESFVPRFRSLSILFYTFMFVLPLLLASASLISPDVAGFLTGANAAYLLIIRKGLPEDSAPGKHRVLRVFAAFLTLAAAALVTVAAIKITGAQSILKPDIIEFVKAFFPASTIWVSVELCFRLGLYEKRNFA